MPAQRRVQYRLAEYLADHRRQFLSPLSAVRAQLLCGEIDGDRGGLPQCAVLIGAED
ncbi:MAG: hypothetical protein ACLQDY_00235 [Streptosporangiaceae bacterium]